MEQPQKLANLAELSNQLAQNNVRVRNFVDQLCTRIDQLVAAATEGDWEEVDRISHHIGRTGASNGYPLIMEAAALLNLDCLQEDGAKRSLSLRT